eukprot:scaffold101706_cov44-Prasinocladus_malaysianus.AAC.1
MTNSHPCKVQSNGCVGGSSAFSAVTDAVTTTITPDCADSKASTPNSNGESLPCLTPVEAPSTSNGLTAVAKEEESSRTLARKNKSMTANESGGS